MAVELYVVLENDTTPLSGSVKSPQSTSEENQSEDVHNLHCFKPYVYTEHSLEYFLRSFMLSLLSNYITTSPSVQLNPVVPGGHTHSLAVFGWKGLRHSSTHMELL